MSMAEASRLALKSVGDAPLALGCVCCSVRIFSGEGRFPCLYVCFAAVRNWALHYDVA